MFRKEKIGKRIAKGGDRKVYMYGPERVIKISTLSFLLGKKLRSKLLYDYEVCKKYFPNFIVETIDVTPENNSGYIEIQEFIHGEMLAKKHFDNVQLRTQFEQLLSGIEQMVEHGYAPIDLIGNGGIFRLRLSNILVDKQEKLKIIDATLLEGKSLGLIGYIFDISVLSIAKVRQRYIVKKFLQ